MGKERMKEVTWHSFMETLSSWLALQEEAFVRELLCIPVKSEIKQVELNAETAARSSKLFYYLTQSLAKWDRGLELLRALQEKVCDHCGKKGHTAEKCWQRQREEKANTLKGKGKGEKGKGDQGKPKGKGRGDKTPQRR
eukprot:s12197_g1.t1